MQPQELSLRTVLTIIRYPLSPRFPDIRGRFIEELTADLDLPQWGWGDDAMTFHNEDLGIVLVAGGREARAQYTRISDVELVVEWTKHLFQKALTELGVAEVTSMGVRSMWTAAAESFGPLRDWMVDSLTSERLNSGIKSLGKLSDVAWVLEFMDEDPKHRLQLGPMTREQYVEKAALQHARPEDVPDSFVFLDLDRIYNETTLEAEDVLLKWEQSLRKNLEMASGFGRALTDLPSVA